MNFGKLLKRAVVILGMILGGVISAQKMPGWLAMIFERFIVWSTGNEPGDAAMLAYESGFVSVACFVFGAIVLGLLTIYVITLIERIIKQWQVMSDGERITLFASVLVGVAISIPFHMLFFTIGLVASLLGFVLMFALIGISHVVLKSMEEVFPWSQRGRARSNLKIFDTNVIIDGRIYEIARAGFLEGKIYIPEFVIKELQLISDSHDPNKRQRGRRGLDMLKHLQSELEVEIGTKDKFAGDEKEPVDSRLVKLALATGAALVTNDFNLNKVAQVQNVKVLNVNDLALAMRAQHLPGEVLNVEIVKEGTQQGQGVAFLEDGTMIVVDNGQSHIGERIDIKITQVHQSTAGRMIFGVPDIEEYSEVKERR